MSPRDGNWEIYTVPLGGGPMRNLSNNPSQDGLPAGSPDGQSVAFVSDRSGQWAVWAMRLDGSGQHMLFPLENGYANGGDLDWTSERISFFFSSRRRHTRSTRDWSSDVCSSD